MTHKSEVDLFKFFKSVARQSPVSGFELFEDMYAAISREKQIKAGSRKARIRLIESINPVWSDLYLHEKRDRSIYTKNEADLFSGRSALHA